MNLRLVILLLIFSFGIGPLTAVSLDDPNDTDNVNEVEDLDELLGGFDDSSESLQKTDETPRAFHFGGELDLGISYNFAHAEPDPGETDWRGLSRLRFNLGLEAQYHFSRDWQLYASGRAYWDAAYSIHGRENYSPEVLEAYEGEIEWTDTFVEGRIAGLELKIGRQIVAWGNSETLRITDVLNPLDLREPGLTDIDDLRLPVCMTRLDLPIGNVNFSAIAIHEIRFDKSPVYGHDFYPIEIPLPPENLPSSSFSNTEFALAITSTFSGWDLSLYFAEFFDDQAHLEYRPTISFGMVHSRLRMFGAAWDMAINNTLLKAEAAHFEGLEFFARPTDEFSRTDVMIGLEYSGFTDTSITFEVVHRQIHAWQDELAQAPDFAAKERNDWVIRWSRFFFNQTLTLSAIGISFGLEGKNGSVERLEARYSLNDNVEITGGVVFYQSGKNNYLAAYGDNDRLFLEIEYRF